jgi:hypothetical protein
MMDGKNKQDLPAEDGEAEAKGAEAREALDEVPEPGTDPLHEGP